VKIEADPVVPRAAHDTEEKSKALRPLSFNQTVDE
jgi:hypothetical protein